MAEDGGNESDRGDNEGDDREEGWAVEQAADDPDGPVHAEREIEKNR